MSAVIGPLPLGIRVMRSGDVAAAMLNEEAAYTHPWTEGILLDCIRVGYHCVVAAVDGRVIGHGVMSVAAGEAHVLNLCIHPDWQGVGYGRSLLQYLVDTATAQKATHMFLEVRESNAVAQRLYETSGFNEIAQRPGYYPAGRRRETALVYARTLENVTG